MELSADHALLNGSNQAIPPFHSDHLIVLADLPIKEKEKYYNFLLNHSVRFVRDESGVATKYVASVRLLAPGVKKADYLLKSKELDASVATASNIAMEDKLSKIHDINVKIVGVEPFEYNSYTRLTNLIAVDGETIKPRHRVLSWLMKTIDELYDSRFNYEKYDEERDPNIPEDRLAQIFPCFVVKRIGLIQGLKHICYQTCWDMVYNTQYYRKQYLDIEMFSKFLDESYGNDDLLFFLYVRSVVMKCFSKWNKGNEASKSKNLWISYRECVHIAKIVFGEENEAAIRDFMALLSSRMAGQKKDNADTRRIDVTQFLCTAVDGYHNAESNSRNEESTKAPAKEYYNPSNPSDFTDGLKSYQSTIKNEQGLQLMQTPSYSDLGSPSQSYRNSAGMDLSTLASTPLETNLSDNDDDVYSIIQREREQEYVDYLINTVYASELSTMTHEVVTQITQMIAQYLRSICNEKLSKISFDSAEDFDDYILDYLQTEELLEIMTQYKHRIYEE